MHPPLLGFKFDKNKLKIDKYKKNKKSIKKSFLK